MSIDNRTSNNGLPKGSRRTSLRYRFLVAQYSILSLFTLCFVACLTPPADDTNDGTITDLTYQNTTIGLAISAPSPDWEVSKNVPDPSKVLIIKYGSTTFNPNVVVSASANLGGDSIPLLTQASIAEFCNDSTFSNKSIMYSGQSLITINGSSFGMVEASVTKSYTNPGNGLQQIDLKIIQYVTEHNGYVLAITFIDTPSHFSTIDTEFVAIRNSIHLL